MPSSQRLTGPVAIDCGRNAVTTIKQLPEVPADPSPDEQRVSRLLSQCALTDLHGTVGPPRANGEPVFDAPWESRAFGMAVALHEKGAFEWREFQTALATELERSQMCDAENSNAMYYRSWLGALESIILVTSTERQSLEHRMVDILAESSHHDEQPNKEG